jgi:hypothetical protein
MAPESQVTESLATESQETKSLQGFTMTESLLQ